LGLTNVGGIFVVLLGKRKTQTHLNGYFFLIMFDLGGVFLSLLVAILEFLWHARKNHANRRVSLIDTSLSLSSVPVK
jgi:hypothetical protein